MKQSRKQFVQHVDTTLKAHGMLANGDRVLIGVSGGPDSVALLLFLLESRGRLGLDLGIAHLNHCLRKNASDSDESFVKHLAGTFNLPCHTRAEDVGALAKKEHLSIEEAARNARYRFYQEVAKKKGYSKLALGHTSDDNAELVLMNLIRGSGPRGLSGIPPVRDNWIVRPMIETSKHEILEYLALNKQPHVVDSSNNDPIFLRNRIRHTLLPILEEQYNPSMKGALNRLSAILREENSWMEDEVRTVFKRVLLKQDTVEVQLSLDPFTNLPSALNRRLVRKAIRKIKGNLRRITLFHVDAAVKLALSGAQGDVLDFPDRIRVRKQKDRICFRQELQPLRSLGRDSKP